MHAGRSSLWLLIALSALVLVATLFARPLWPVDETRYVAAAWEMWLRGDFLVPYLNGAPYSHKPPLMFWLMQLGWAVFGVNEWWPRLVAPLFAMGSLWLTALLARRLWPDTPARAELAPWIAFGALLWLVFSSLTMFDMLVVFFTLVGMLGITRAWRMGGARGFVELGVAIGFGVLSKGPVILLHLLPVALAAPWWAIDARPNWRRWYGGVGLAVALGALIALAWAVPAGLVGGAEYRDAIFWGQTAGRVNESFHHSFPWWWYLPLLPIVLFPWFLWLPVWRGLWRLRKAPRDAALRFCWAWLVLVFLLVSLVAGKQPHYLLPLFPVFALLAAYALTATQDDGREYDTVPVALGLGAVAGLWMFLVRDPQAFGIDAASAPSLRPGIVMAVCAFAVLFTAPLSLLRRVQALVLALVAVLAAAFAGAADTIGPGLDLRPMAQRLKSLEEQGRPVAHLGKYHGQFQFLGRLTRPLESVTDDAIVAWLVEHPNGYVVGSVYGTEYARLSNALRASDPAPLSPGLAAEFVQPHRRGGLYLARLDTATARAIAQVGGAEAARRIQLPSPEKPDATIARKAVVRWRTAD
jgi:4-amino-4-deoxy-L-arabinose transferase-like glycosyltransferase